MVRHRAIGGLFDPLVIYTVLRHNPFHGDGLDKPAGERHWLDDLNAAQRAAATYGELDASGACRAGPLLIIAGAGTGKTNTLAHRVAHLVLNGVAPERILLLTFSRRAAQEMIRRAQRIVAKATGGDEASAKAPAVARLAWAGTFHSVANRLLRRYAAQVGLQRGFSVMDRGDSADLLDLARQDARAFRERTSASRARTRASRSIRIASTRAARSSARSPTFSRGAPSGTTS